MIIIEKYISEFRIIKPNFKRVTIVKIFMYFILALTLFFSKEEFKEEKLVVLIGYLILIYIVYIGYSYYKTKNYSIKISENGLIIEKNNEINWSDINNVVVKPSGKFESLIISYNSGNIMKEITINKFEIENYETLKKLIIEKTSEKSNNILT